MVGISNGFVVLVSHIMASFTSCLRRGLPSIHECEIRSFMLYANSELEGKSSFGMPLA